MAEQNSNWNGIPLIDCADPHQSDTKDQMSAKKEKDEEKGTQKDEKKKKLYKSVTVQLKGPYRKIEYSLYRPAKGEAYRPIQGVKVDPKLIKEKKSKWKLKEKEKFGLDFEISWVTKRFFDFPKGGSEKSQADLAKIQLLILLAQISSILVENNFTLPVIYLGGGSKEIYEGVEELLKAVQGEGIWEGYKCELNRKWLIRPVIGENASCTSPEMVDYICGLCSRNYNRRKFWVGYAESAVAIREDVDETIRNEILKTSEFIIPILFEKPGRKKLGCTEIQIPGTCLNGCHEKIRTFIMRSALVHGCIAKFIKKFYKNEVLTYKDRARCLRDHWKERMELYRPTVVQENRSQSIAEEDLYCAALAFLELLLEYLKNENILEKTEIKKILLDYCRWVLPGSPQINILKSACQPLPSLNTPISRDEYNDLEVFYKFLLEYAFEPEHRCERSKYGSSECRRILHTLKKENEEYFIAPRDELLKAYQEWLGKNLCTTFPSDEGEKKWEDKLYEAGVKLKRSDKGKDSWRYQYYKDQPPVCCIGIPMKEIKEAVKKYDLSNFDSQSEWFS